MLMQLARRSLQSRRASLVLTLVSLCISLVVLLAVQQIRMQAKESFSRTISGVDLIVGARTGSINLLLSSVYRIGGMSNAISPESYQALSEHKLVDWSVPIVLGDSHRGFPVVGTTDGYFEHYQYGNKQALVIEQGQGFVVDTETQQSVVLGASVASKLGYTLNDNITLSHGTGKISFSHHDNVSFVVSGILAPTGTPIDQSLHVSLHAIELMHPQTETQSPTNKTHKHDHEHDHDQDHNHDHASHGNTKINAVLLGLQAKYATLVMQKFVNDFEQEPLMAIIPGVTLTELWRLMGGIENVLLLISILVLVATLLGMTTMMLASMRERKKEFAIYRAVGASPWQIVYLIQLEVVITMLLSLLISHSIIYGISVIAQSWLSLEFGLFIEPEFINTDLLFISFSSLVLAMIVGFIPAWSAYRTAKGVSVS